MKNSKEAKYHHQPWEDDYGYAQAILVEDVIYLSGQFSHDQEGNFVAPAPTDADGNILDHSNMEEQMRQTYKNAAIILDKFNATMDQVVEEVIYVTDMNEAMAVAGKVRKEAYGSSKPEVASTLLVTPRLAQPHQLVEVKFIAYL